MSDYWCNDVELLREIKNSMVNYRVPKNIIVGEQIPRILHFVWLGTDVPRHCQTIIAKSTMLHPSWEIKVWRDDDIAALKDFENRQIFDLSTNYGM